MIKSLYVHIPFCIKKCFYCDFNSYSDFSAEDQYFDALLKEIDNIDYNNFSTIFVGGGTPTSVTNKNLEKLLKKLSKYNVSEYTFEANPGTVDYQKLKMMKYYGVNRISLGLQAYQDSLLLKLGRIHKFDDFLKSFDAARSANFSNINIDLMFGIPDQTLKDWIETLNAVLKLNPEHLSCYGLIIEEETPFYDLYKNNKLILADEDTEREMYYRAVEVLNWNKYIHYEISNFSKENYECNHNITYWKDDEYIGVGAGAHSYVGNRRYCNYKSISEYIESMDSNNPVAEENVLTNLEEISEYMFLGLRMLEGVTFENFKNRFTLNMLDVYDKQIQKSIKNGLLDMNSSGIYLTKRGIDLSNQVFSEFILY